MICLMSSSYLTIQVNEKRTETKKNAEMNNDFLHLIFFKSINENEKAELIINDVNNKVDDNINYIAVLNFTVISNSF